MLALSDRRSYVDFMDCAKSSKVYICKPENSCQGKGIRLIRGSKARSAPYPP